MIKIADAVRGHGAALNAALETPLECSSCWMELGQHVPASEAVEVGGDVQGWCADHWLGLAKQAV